MTAYFDAFIAAGSGKLDFELRIEGLSRIFVTNEDHAAIADASGRTRVPGLSREGIGFSERVYLAGAELDIAIDGLTIEEVGGSWLGVATEVFTKTAARVTTLTATLTAASTTVTVLDSSVLTDGYYYLGTETVKVTARPTGTTATIDRGQWQSTAQEHPVSSGESAIATDIYDAPTGMAGRRVWLYARTVDEALEPSITVIWRGLLGREATLVEDDALAWSLAIEPRTKALDASLAGGFDRPFALRGIYYPGVAPFAIQVIRFTTSAANTAEAYVLLKLANFYETQTAFLEALLDALNGDATIQSWGISFSADEDDGAWRLFVTVASTPRYIGFRGGSCVDGAFRLAPGESNGLGGYRDLLGVAVASTTYLVQYDAYGDFVPGLTLGQADARRVPRHNTVTLPGPDWIGTDAEISSYPVGRAYLDRLGSLTTGDDLVVVPQWVRGPSPAPDDVAAEVLPISAIDSTLGTVTVSAWDGLKIIAGGSVQPVITGGARYASTGNRDLDDLRLDLLTRAPTVANRGQGPWVTSDDIDGWGAEVDEACAGRPWLQHRVYTWSKPVKAIDVLREEWKLHGLFPHLNTDARLVVDLLTIDTASAASVAITADNILSDETLGSVTGDADGLVTVVHVLRGYDPAEDKHVERDFIYRGMAAIARVHAERILEIAPMSRAVGAEPTWEELYDRAASLISFFGTRRCTSITFECTLTKFAVLVGDWIDLTIAALPLDGARGEWTSGGGIAARRALVIGRRWDVSSGVGRFEVLVSEMAENVAGYAPACRVTAAAGAGADWTLTVTATHYSTDGDTSHFAAGQAIRLIEFDAATPTIVEGTIDVINSTTSIDVTVAAWGGMGGATYYVMAPDTSDDAQTTATQLTRSYLASSAGRIPLAAGTQAARDLAP